MDFCILLFSVHKRKKLKSEKHTSITQQQKLAERQEKADSLRMITAMTESDYRRKWDMLIKKEIDPLDLRNPDDLLPHKDEEQIKLDVDRSMVFYPTISSEDERKKLRQALLNVLVRFFRENPQLCYYQGLHDICTVFLLIFVNEEDCYCNFSSFALVHLRDFMMPNLTPSILILDFIPQLVSTQSDSSKLDLLLGEIPPFYCLSPIITLFSHDIKDWPTICLVFDHIISNNSIEVIIYLYVCLLLRRLKSLVVDADTIDADDLHKSLSGILDDVTSQDIIDIIPKAVEMNKQFPLSKLRAWNALCDYSVLRTEKLPDVASRIDELIVDQLHQAMNLSKSKSSDTQSLLLSKTLKVTFTIGVVGIVLNIILYKNASW